MTQHIGLGAPFGRKVGQADTIAALASGGLPSGIAVIRLSGPAVPAAFLAVMGRVPEPRRASLARFRDATGAEIDTGLAIYFPGPGSATGEDCGEFQVHGGRAVVSAMLAALRAVPGIRLAEAGEFARRALINGRADLLGTEALSDLIAAETESERRFAIENGRDRHRSLYSSWRSTILHARSMVEAELDFADEDDVPGSVSESSWATVGSLIRDIEDHLDGYRKARIVRGGFDVVIAGPPNAGKSSLLNRLVEEEVAIVTSEAGTTRDLVSATIDLGGMKVNLTDTAGIREAENLAEQIGIERSRRRMAEADLVLSLFSPAEGQIPLPLERDGDTLVIATKCDMPYPGGEVRVDHIVSVETGTGFAAMLEDIAARARAAAPAVDDVVPWRERHVELLSTCRDCLADALIDKPLELRSEDLRRASLALGKLAGDIDVEDMLDEIFSKFCIGK
jgi:tRNA modification GTPase